MDIFGHGQEFQEDIYAGYMIKTLAHRLLYPSLLSLALSRHSCLRIITGILYLLILVINPGHGQAEIGTPMAIEINSGQFTREISPWMHVYHTEDSLSADQAWQAIQNNELRQTEDKVNQGMNYPEQSFWVTIAIANKSEVPAELMIEIMSAKIPFSHLYEKTNTGFQKLYTIGTRLPFHERPVTYRNHVFPTRMDKGATKLYLINIIKRQGPLTFPILVQTKKSFNQKKLRESVLHTVYFSIIGLMSLISLVLGIFVLQRKVFIYYSCYIFFLAAAIFTTLGYTYQFVIPNEPAIIRHTSAFLSTLATAFFIAYVNSLFKAKEQFPVLYRICLSLIIMITVTFLFWISFPKVVMNQAQWLLPLRYIITVFIFFLFTYYAIKSWKKDRIKSALFLFGHLFMILGASLSILLDLSLMSRTLMVVHPLMIGVLIDIFSLSVIMGFILKRHLANQKVLKGSVAQMQSKIKHLEKEQISNTSPKKSHIRLKSRALIAFADIQLITSDGHYVEFHLKNKSKPEIDRNTIKATMDVLPTDQFVQTHRSYIVNINEINMIYASKIVLKDYQEIPVSRTYKAAMQAVADQTREC